MKELVKLFFPLLFLNSLLDFKLMPVAFACTEISFYGHSPKTVLSNFGRENSSKFFNQQLNLLDGFEKVIKNFKKSRAFFFAIQNLKFKPFLHPT